MIAAYDRVEAGVKMLTLVDRRLAGSEFVALFRALLRRRFIGIRQHERSW